ncbi:MULTISPECIES: WD40/YVTN/BNR-like repeat-containing protein [Burkholderia]|nr:MULTISPECIES: glycosyl hydrolase [Burkholderia]MCC5030024.1 glycosyl hydrolase [Burkholderia dolosa]UEB53409.1 glycosyl hydrolase [Burkholderia dolosa]UEC16689.1 glycosyl hydrolase [Burkholderia dolosa]
MLIVLIVGYTYMPNDWMVVSNNFMKNSKPYGAGDFVISGNEAMTLKISQPEITFKPYSEWTDKEKAEPSEAWMNDSRETLNRTSVEFWRGPINGDMARHFRQPGQTAAWWHSSDWSVEFISTGWMDYKSPQPVDGLTPQLTKLWKSSDGGRDWIQLDWPEDRNIDRLLFLDPQRGYAVGWGPHVWRTPDGGRTWREIGLPPDAMDPRKPRRTFDGIDLGPDGTLRIAYYVAKSDQGPARSVVYKLGWEQTSFTKDAVLPGQVVVNLSSSPVTSNRYALYALSRLGEPRNVDDPADKGQRIGALSTWTNSAPQQVQQLHAFDEKLTVDSLSVGRDGLLIVYATDTSPNGAPVDFTFVSSDAGKTWSQTKEKAAQGGYFNAQTNTLYSLVAYTLKKRQF